MNSNKPESEKLRVERTAVYYSHAICDKRGSLLPREVGNGLPFVPQRAFIVFDVPPGTARGGHAHLSCEQMLVCLRGSVFCKLDDGSNRQEWELSSPEVGLYVGPMVWTEHYNYSEGAILQVFSSQLYDPEEVLRDYQKFSSMCAAQVDVG